MGTIKNGTPTQDTSLGQSSMVAQAVCRLCGRQNGVGKLSEFVKRRCTSRDQNLRYEVMCRIQREPHPGCTRDKWQQRSLKSFFVLLLTRCLTTLLVILRCPVKCSHPRRRIEDGVSYIAAPSTTFFSTSFGQCNGTSMSDESLTLTDVKTPWAVLVLGNRKRREVSSIRSDLVKITLKGDTEPSINRQKSSRELQQRAR